MPATATPVRPKDWWDDRREIARLLSWLNTTGRLTPELAVDVVDEPWHWTLEYDHMVAEEREAEAA